MSTTTVRRVVLADCVAIDRHRSDTLSEDPRWSLRDYFDHWQGLPIRERIRIRFEMRRLLKIGPLY